MGPFSFLDLFLRNKLPVESSELTTDVAVKYPFDELSLSEQEVVREYFRSAMAVQNMFESLRRGLSVLHGERTLERFERAEKHYSGIGFLPVLPAGMHLQGNRLVLDLKPEHMAGIGLLVRRASGELPRFYATAMKNHAERLKKRKPEVVATSATVTVLKPRRKDKR